MNHETSRFEVGGPGQGLCGDKWMPSASDTVSKVWGTHTLKAGVFWEQIGNSQPANNATQGTLGVSKGNPNSTGNPYVDLLAGVLNSYAETSVPRTVVTCGPWARTRKRSRPLGSQE